MVAVSEASSGVSGRVDAPSVVVDRLEAFGVEVLAPAMNRSVQVLNGGVYLRGLIEQGARKSLEPMVHRLGGDADYQSLQQFLADSPWDPGLVVRAVAERVAPRIGVEAWVLDDTGFPKDGKDSPGVKHQYSGTLGKTGNCQIGVSVHAVGRRGTVPLGWALYLPEDWCENAERRRKAKIPDEVMFKTKPELGVELVQRAASWDVPKAPVLGDHAYGENTRLRDRLDQAGCEYVLSVGPTTKVFEHGTAFAVPTPKGNDGRGAIQAAAGPQARTNRRSHRRARSRHRPDGRLPRRTRRRTGLLQVHLRARSRRSWLARRSAPQRMARGRRGSPARRVADRRMARGRGRTDRLLDLKPPRRHPARAARAARAGCAGRSSSTTNNSRASSASTTTRAAHGSGGITTPRW